MELLSGLIGTIFSKGLDYWNGSREARLVKLALRDRLHREVRLNLEIWKLFDQRKNKPTPEFLASLLSIKAFDEVCTLNFPLSELLGTERLSPNVCRHLQLEGKTNANKRVRQRVKSISTEVDLIERIWHRLHILKERQQLGGSLGDNDYLKHLLVCLDISLNERKKISKRNK